MELLSTCGGTSIMQPAMGEHVTWPQSQPYPRHDSEITGSEAAGDPGV